MRVALGAGCREIVGLVLWSVLRVTAIGIAGGIVGALLLGGVLTSQFSAVQPADAVAIACVAASLVIVSFLAGLCPALRATRVDPLTALRQK